MKKMLVLLAMLLMVGCEAKEAVTPKEVKEIIKQEQQVEQPKEEVKEEVKEQPKKELPKEEVKQVEKELPKKEEPKKEAPKKIEKEPTKKEIPKKKEQDDNIDPETGLAKVKDGTHLEEEAKEQEEEGIIEPEEDYNGEDYDDDWLIEYGNTEDYDEFEN